MPRDDADALRRRLYGPDASADDVARYRAAVPASATPGPEPGPAPAAVAEPLPSPEVRRPRRRGRLVVVAAVLVVVAVVGVAAVRIGEVQRLEGLRAPAIVSADPVDRDALEQNLAAGNKAGIAAYLVTHRTPRSMAGASRYFTVEEAGTGRVELDLAPVPADAVRGRATVLLVVGGDSVATWTTYRRAVDSAGEQQWVRQTTRGGAQSAGVLTGTTFRYAAGDRPVRLVVDVDDGVRWGAAVVFSD